MTERELNRLLQESLEGDEAFRLWFLSQLSKSADHDRLVLCRSDNPWSRTRAILQNAQTGVLEAVVRDGEKDVLAVFENSAGKRLAVHVETKLGNGRFTEYQPEMYAARAEQWIGHERYGSYHDWETVLIAPRRFVERNSMEAKKFYTRITHEQVATMIPAFAAETERTSIEATPEKFPNRVLLKAFEGGAVYTAESGGKFYVIQDESSLAALIDDEDLGELTKVLEFPTADERSEYIRNRGWAEDISDIDEGNADA